MQKKNLRSEKLKESCAQQEIKKHNEEKGVLVQRQNNLFILIYMLLTYGIAIKKIRLLYMVFKKALRIV